MYSLWKIKIKECYNSIKKIIKTVKNVVQKSTKNLCQKCVTQKNENKYL